MIHLSQTIDSTESNLHCDPSLPNNRLHRIHATCGTLPDTRNEPAALTQDRPNHCATPCSTSSDSYGDIIGNQLSPSRIANSRWVFSLFSEVSDVKTRFADVFPHVNDVIDKLVQHANYVCYMSDYQCDYVMRKLSFLVRSSFCLR